MFLQQLAALEAAQPEEYGVAVANIRQDLHGTGNPCGNVTEAAHDALKSECAKYSPTATDHLHDAIARHLSFCTAAGCSASTVTETPLRTVVPYVVYWQYHMRAPDEGRGAPAEDPASSDESSLNLDLAAALAEPENDVDVILLRGGTGRVDRATWWSFGRAAPATGREYVEELALPGSTLVQLAEASAIVEIQVGRDALPEPLYKPSSLDGFCAGSRFKPDLTDTPHGWTDPKDGYEKRPEVVSRAFRYARLKGKASALKVTTLPYG